MRANETNAAVAAGITMLGTAINEYKNINVDILATIEQINSYNKWLEDCGVQGNKANNTAQQQQYLAQDQYDLQKNMLEIVLQGQLQGIDTDIRETEAQIQSYDQWLASYGNQYAQEVQSKQVQTDTLMASGRETYENFLNAIGYADADAGATGRVGAGTSQAHTTGMLDQKLVDYVGEDRMLDATGGLFGSQLTAANMEMGQLRVDLELQRQQVQIDRNIANESLTGYNQTKGDYGKFFAENFS